MKSNYINLDLLRSLAVLSVVAAHLWHGCVAYHLLPYSDVINQFLHNLSFTGVMFFFVHTCLVLMLSLHRSPAEGRARNFLIRRAFRIYPLSWAAILLALTTGLTDQSMTSIHAAGTKGILANLLLVQNVVRSVPSILGPLWSLPWEVQMYLLLPLFYFALRRFESFLPSLWFWLGATALAFVCTSSALPRSFHATVFPPMFIGGMVAYQLLHRQSESVRCGYGTRRIAAGLWPLFVIALFAVQGILMGWHSFESQTGSAINSCVCLVLALAIPSFRELSTQWLVRPTEKIAKYSYGIYLLHVPALEIVFRAAPSLPLALKCLLFLLVTTALSVAAYHTIEHPLIQFGKQLTDGKRKQAVRDIDNGEIAMTRNELPAKPQSNADLPLVSIVTPVFNAARWLPQTLASVQAQTFFNWEHILVDDGSTDGSVQLIKEAARIDKRVHLIQTQKNSGPAVARNLAIKSARGRYIAFLDADDLWLPEKLARSIDWMEQNDYTFIYHDYRHMSHDGELVSLLIRGPEVLNMRTLHTRRGTGGCLSVVIDRSMVPDFHFPLNYKLLHEDFCAWMSLIRSGHLGHRLPLDLGRYRLLPKSRSANKLNGAYNTWLIYREVSRLNFVHAAYWWLQYAWNGFWLYRWARPR
jgi:peptidoglycan/LPS O-acetylase OafA/YrhL/glycosyltransferase involved in cell wall biosynthesis